MKKAAAVTLAVLLLICSACAGNAFEFDKEEAVSAAKEVAELVHAQDYEALHGLFREDVRPLITAEALQAAVQPILEQAGAFQEYEKADAASYKDKQYGDLITVALKAKYENAALTYTISFDRDYALMGLYIQ